MTYQDVKDMIAGFGLPCAYYQFTKQTAQPPPFICFYFSDDADLVADDTNYQKIANLTIELYTETKDFETEGQIESALNEAGFVYRRDETAIDSEQMYMVAFYTSVVITEDD